VTLGPSADSRPFIPLGTIGLRVFLVVFPVVLGFLGLPGFLFCLVFFDPVDFFVLMGCLLLRMKKFLLDVEGLYDVGYALGGFSFFFSFRPDFHLLAAHFIQGQEAEDAMCLGFIIGAWIEEDDLGIREFFGLSVNSIRRPGMDPVFAFYRRRFPRHGFFWGSDHGSTSLR
jgi:hypothetical protein